MRKEGARGSGGSPTGSAGHPGLPAHEDRGQHHLDGEERALRRRGRARRPDREEPARRGREEAPGGGPDQAGLLLRPSGGAQEQHPQHGVPGRVEAVLAVHRGRRSTTARHLAGALDDAPDALHRRHHPDRGEEGHQAAATGGAGRHAGHSGRATTAEVVPRPESGGSATDRPGGHAGPVAGLAITTRATAGEPPADPLGTAVAAAVAGVLYSATVELAYAPASAPLPETPPEVGAATATGSGPPGWQMAVTLRLGERRTRIVGSGDGPWLAALLAALPAAAIRAVAPLRSAEDHGAPVDPAVRRALRDMVAAEVLTDYLRSRVARPVQPGLVGEAIEFLIELSGTRVESHDLTHGVVITDALEQGPRIRLAYPRDVRAAKRAPLLFDGQRSVLLVDLEGLARTELQRHRFAKLARSAEPGAAGRADRWDSGALVADATRALGGLGFFVRADRSIWTFVEGQPLLVRRGEHWTAFPLELTSAIAMTIGGGAVAELVARAAFIISAQP